MEFVAREKPEVLCLQEVKAHREQVEPEMIDMGRGFQNVWSPAQRKGYSGVATFWSQAAKPVDQSIGLGHAEYDQEGRVVVTDHQRFLLYNIYFPNGGSGPERHEFKQRFLEDLLVHLRKVLAGGRELVVVGDYNIAAEPIDVYDPSALAEESGFLAQEREWMKRFFDLGLIDSFRWVHGATPNRYSWWNQIERAREFNRGWRIDYACLSRGLLRHLRHADVLDQVEGSDHAPVLLELDFASEGGS